MKQKLHKNQCYSDHPPPVPGKLRVGFVEMFPAIRSQNCIESIVKYEPPSTEYSVFAEPVDGKQ